MRHKNSRTEPFWHQHGNPQQSKQAHVDGGTVAEWSKALLRSEEKINEHQKILGVPPGPCTSKKNKTMWPQLRLRAVPELIRP